MATGAGTYPGAFRPAHEGMLPVFMFALLASAVLAPLAVEHSLIFSSCAAALLLFAAFTARPMTGVYLFILIFPIQSIFLLLNGGWPNPVRVLFFELFTIIMLAALAVKLLSDHGRPASQPGARDSSWFSWIYFASAAFIVWSGLTLFWANNSGTPAIGWWKLNCNFIACAYVLTFVDSFKKLVRIAVVICSMAVLLAIAAIYAGHYGLYSLTHLFASSDVTLKLEAFLINEGGSFIPRMLGRSPSFGFSAKHELGAFLSCGIILSLFLMTRYKSVFARLLLCLLILLFSIAHFMALAKAAMLGLPLILVAICLAIPAWRKHLAALVVVALATIWAAGNIGYHLQPEPLQILGSGYIAEQVTHDSRYQPGTYSHRLKLMQKAIDEAIINYGLGGGPDSMDKYIGFFHGHNFLLTFSADYGIPGALFVLTMLYCFWKFAHARILSVSSIRNPVWLLRCAMLACLLITLFEYSVDCYIWYPHIWFFSALFLAAMRIDGENA